MDRSEADRSEAGQEAEACRARDTAAADIRDRAEAVCARAEAAEDRARAEAAEDRARAEVAVRARAEVAVRARAEADCVDGAEAAHVRDAEAVEADVRDADDDHDDVAAAVIVSLASAVPAPARILPGKTHP